MYLRERRPAWTAVPAFALILASSVTVGPRANAASTVPTITTAFTLDADHDPNAVFNAVFIVAAQIPVAAVMVPRLPSTSTSNYEPLKPVNFVQGFALGFALVLIGWLLLLESRKSA